jgi:hypothetical protein
MKDEADREKENKKKSKDAVDTVVTDAAMGCESGIIQLIFIARMVKHCTEL